MIQLDAIYKKHNFVAVSPQLSLSKIDYKSTSLKLFVVYVVKKFKKIKYSLL